MTFSIIQKSQLEGTERIDAEYYQPEYLEIDRIISNLNHKTLKDISEKVFSGPFGSTLKSESYQDKGIPFIRIGDIDDVFINGDNLVYISLEEHKRIFSTYLKPGDIVFSKIGTIGRLSVISNELGEVNISENNIGIRLSNLTHEKKVFLLFFLLCKYGQSQILRKGSGNIQQKLNVVDIETIKVPNLTGEMYSFYLDLYEQMINFRTESNLLYSQAENLLLEELKLKDFKFNDDLFFVINSSEAKDRFDTDYFEPKYQQLISQLNTFETKTLGELITMKKGFEPGGEAYEEEGKLFIRVSSLSSLGLIDKDQKYLKNNLYQELENDFQPQLGEILLTKDATPGTAYVLKEQVEGIISGGILRLKLKEDIEPEYLALCINSMVGKMQVERDAGGSVIEHWKTEQIKNLLIPVLSKPIQQKIAELVKKSHEARKKSKELLIKAKKKVEEMIEKGSK